MPAARAAAFGLRGHVAVSRDGGTAWAAIQTGLSSELLGGTRLADGRVLLVGTRGGALLLDAALDHARKLEASGHGSFADVAQTADGHVLAVGDAGMTELPIDPAGAPP